jgi:uncharacterized phage protein gp47/JayE
VAVDPIYPYISVYGREGPSSPYRAYNAWDPGKNPGADAAGRPAVYAGGTWPLVRAGEGGRFYMAERLPDGAVRFRFGGEGLGPPPGAGEGDLLIVCCTEAMERARALGPVLGYVDQEIDIDVEGGIIADDFMIMLETVSLNGEACYEPVRPGETTPDGFMYELLADRNRICVRKPETGRDCRAYVASCAVTLGKEGNVRGETVLEGLAPEGAAPAGAAFVNPAPGRGGRDPESLSELRARFSASIKTPWAAVTAQDYESIVLSAPGLCIHKAKALPNPAENSVMIVVKPRGEEPFPRLSESYIRRIRELLEPRRMLSTSFTLLQPRYLPIDVKGDIYVKSRFANARADIERALAEALDFVSSDAGFGEPVLFDKVFRAVAGLPCVLTVMDLSITPGSRGAASLNGLDIIPNGDCLCYPGKISIGVNARAER